MTSAHKIDINQLMKYMAVGSFSALIYFGILVFSVEVADWSYIFSVSVAYICTITFHFLANKVFTFRSRGNDVVREIARYVVLVLINYLITLAVVLIVVEGLGQNTYIGAIVAVAVTLGVGYSASKFWVFHHTRGAL